MKTSLVHITPGAERLIAYCARVSSPNQENPEFEGLLKYCTAHKHWSVFEMASMCIEIHTSRAIAQQILRHRSFHFQEFSQRYAMAWEFETYPARRQDVKNRQNSIDDLDTDTKTWFEKAQDVTNEVALWYYHRALEKGIAKEQARFLLPLSVSTKMYMHGTVRDWIHYIELRCGKETQLEHRQIAENIKLIFSEQLPTISKALGWT